MKTRSVLTVSAVAALTGVGCGGLDLTYATQGLIGCDDMTCSNSVNLPAQGLLDCREGCVGIFPGFHQAMKLHGFHELNLAGLLNYQGLTIQTVNGHAQIMKTNSMYNLKVQQGRLIGIQGTAVIQAEELIGAIIDVGRWGDFRAPIAFSDSTAMSSIEPQGMWFSMRIDNVRRFSKPFSQSGEIEVYRISVLVRSSMWSMDIPLCASSDHEDLASVGASRGMEPGEVILFEGDRIDVERKTMSRQLEPNWFNFGCEGSALAKLYLMSETVVTQPTPFDDFSWQERQAMFKMLVADYCGTGLAFTVPGEPLLWHGGRVPYALPPANLEARWNADGAICLGTPRLDVYPAPASGFSTEILMDIAAKCGDRMPPPCVNADPYDADGAIIVSGNRP